MALLQEEPFTLFATVGKLLLLIIAAVGALLSIPGIRLLIFSKQEKSGAPRRGRKLPPGPKPWPLVGNLPAVGVLPHQSLAQLARTYGPLMYLRLGSVPTFVASSPEMAEQILKTHDRVFASRPCLMAGEIFGYGSQSFGLMKYGDHWKSMRKLFVTELLPAKRITNTQKVRTEEVRLMLQSLLKASEKGDIDAAGAGEPTGGRSGVRVYQQFFQMTTNVVTRMMFSKRMFGQSSASNFNTVEFQRAVEDVSRLLGAFNISDVIPALKRFDLQGYEKEMWATQKRMDPILQGLVDTRAKEIREGKAPEDEDFMDVLLTRPLETTGKPMSHEQIKAMLIDVVLAGTDTSAVTLEWAMSELIRNPTLLRRCEEEVDSVVGQERLVNEDDLPNLPLVRAVVKETLRLHPAGALMLPHESIEDCEVAGGFFIPAKSRVMVNVWAIGRDPAVWDRADEFIPDRFLPHKTDSTGLDINAREFRLLPFGSGRRSCPGMQLAVRMIAHALAVLLHSCHWTLLAPEASRPEDLDMSEKFKLSVARAEPLVLVPTPRLPASVLAIAP